MRQKLYYIPIEPLEERYTEQWYRKFAEEFGKNYDVTIIDGNPLSDTVDVGTFLDINSTIAYKNTQMEKVAKLFRLKQVPNGTKFFFGDTEFWGLESLRLMADMNGVDIQIYSFLHAGSYTKEDAFEIAEPYQKYTELGWIMSCDAVFVGSNYHKQAFVERRIDAFAFDNDRNILADKIVVTGNPAFVDEYPKFDIKKQNKIIISNRFDFEKRPNISLDFAVIFKSMYPDWEIVITTSRDSFKSNRRWLKEYALALESKGIITIKSGLSKNEYYEELASSKVMLTNSIEENFGYCILEALYYNTYPLCPNKLSHPELCENDSRLLFDDEDEIMEKLPLLMNSTFDVTKYVDKYKHVVSDIIQNME